MPKESLAQVTKRRLLGVLFIVLVAGLVTLSIAIYNKAFTSTVNVTLKIDHTGNQLLLASDVKQRGIIVGSVKAVRADGDRAKVTLELQPDRVSQIPSNVTAQILPKTLFGEQYVALGMPTHPAAPIAAGDVIPQDRSKGALETERVIGDLLPLLQAVKPAELNATLTAVATALKGRSKELADTLVNADKYLNILNPHTNRLVNDLQKLGQVSEEYNNVAPDIFATLRNLQTSVKTVVQKRAGLHDLLTSGTSGAQVLSEFLAQNRAHAIEIVGQSDKIFALLQEYSPEYKCLFQGINNLQTLANTIIYDDQIHLSAVLDATNLGKYVPGESPTFITGKGPHCFGLPDNIAPVVDGKFQIPDEFRCINDGAALTADACSQDSAQSKRDSAIGSPAENALVDTLIAGRLGTTPDKVPGGATILAGPLLRGQQVVVK